MYLDRVKERVQELHLLAQNVVWPCTEQEIEQLEEWMHISLPAAYKEFLLWMGHRAGGLFFDAHCHYWDLEHNQIVAAQMLQENNFPVSLPQDAFVFYIDQATIFYFFLLSEGEDPPVYMYEELMPGPTFPLAYHKYSEYLAAEVEKYANFRQRVATREKLRERRKELGKERGGDPL